MRRLLLYSLIIFLFGGCKKEEITLYNTQVTPDLSNPLIQKLTGVTWYRDGMNTVQEEWTTLLNIPKPSEAMASMLYSMAWTNLTLHRDGTSSMLYLPPVFPQTYMHLQGTWVVSTTEENTVIINTKTPVSTAIIKLKVQKLETQGAVALLQASMDFGNRMLQVYMSNNTVDNRLATFDDSWYTQHPISDAPLQAQDYIGSWATAKYDLENHSAAKYPAENIVRSTHADDIFAQTPNIFTGMKFSLEEGGRASLTYSKEYLNLFKLDKPFGSDARWTTKGNKLILECDEEFFYSAGEVLFGFPINTPNLTNYGSIAGTPIRTQAKRFYVIELIKKEQHGMWCRITGDDVNFYGFLFKTNESNEVIPIKELTKQK